MIEVYFDGAVEPVNPGGVGSIGAIIKQDGKDIYEISKVIGDGNGMTNNVAEYRALIEALRFLVLNGMVDENIQVYGDSAMVCYQMNGLWRIKNGVYKESAIECKNIVKQFSNLKIDWIPRESNTEADELSKRCNPNKPKRNILLCDKCKSII